MRTTVTAELGCTNGIMSSAILAANFPTLVPPYFCTSHLAAGSMVFWCMFGGVRGALIIDSDEERDEGVEGDVGVEARDMAGLRMVENLTGV